MKNTLKKELMIKNVKINTIDERGWYIVSGGINGGINYLYTDGMIREGAQSTAAKDVGAVGFWPTEELAQAFFEKWVYDVDGEFWDGLGMT